jgi:SAM-dependent methyltransferase
MNPQNKFTMSWEQSVQWLRDQPGNERLIKACYFDDPLEEAAKRYYIEDEWCAIQKILPSSPGKALDVGSGRGIAAYALAMDGWTVTALEPDPSSLVGAQAIKSLAQKTKVEINVVTEWGEKLPFENESFNIIHARQVLHHAKDLKQFCKELFRVCSVGGTLVATREHVINRDEDLPVFLASHPLHHLYGGEHAYKLNDYLSALQEAGFTIETVFSPYESPINYFPAKISDINKAISKKIFGRFLPNSFALRFPTVVINFFSRNMRAPGRLYTFVAKKSAR